MTRSKKEMKDLACLFFGKNAKIKKAYNKPDFSKRPSVYYSEMAGENIIFDGEIIKANIDISKPDSIRFFTTLKRNIALIISKEEKFKQIKINLFNVEITYEFNGFKIKDLLVEFERVETVNRPDKNIFIRNLCMEIFLPIHEYLYIKYNNGDTKSSLECLNLDQSIKKELLNKDYLLSDNLHEIFDVIEMIEI